MGRAPRRATPRCPLDRSCTWCRRRCSRSPRSSAVRLQFVVFAGLLFFERAPARRSWRLQDAGVPDGALLGAAHGGVRRRRVWSQSLGSGLGLLLAQLTRLRCSSPRLPQYTPFHCNTLYPALLLCPSRSGVLARRGGAWRLHGRGCPAVAYPVAKSELNISGEVFPRSFQRWAGGHVPLCQEKTPITMATTLATLPASRNIASAGVQSQSLSILCAVCVLRRPCGARRPGGAPRGW